MNWIKHETLSEKSIGWLSLFEQLSLNLPHEICKEFRTALTLGYWKNGLQLSDKQRKICEQALFYSESNKTSIMH